MHENIFVGFQHMGLINYKLDHHFHKRKVKKTVRDLSPTIVIIILICSMHEIAAASPALIINLSLVLNYPSMIHARPILFVTFVILIS